MKRVIKGATSNDVGDVLVNTGNGVSYASLIPGVLIPKDAWEGMGEDIREMLGDYAATRGETDEGAMLLGGEHLDSVSDSDDKELLKSLGIWPATNYDEVQYVEL